MKPLIHYSLTHDKYKSTKMHCYYFLQSKFHNSRPIWQVDQIQNKIIQSCQSTMILVLDSLILILNFVNWAKARFIEKLGFPDIKSVPQEGEGCGGGISTCASFNLFVLLTYTLNGQDKLWGHQNLNDKVGCMRVIFQSITRVDRCMCLQLIFKNFRKLQIYIDVAEVESISSQN